MQENKNNCQVCGAGEGGYCGSCGMSRNYFGNHILRWILGIIIISWVFSIGMKIGELKAMIETSRFGNNMMFRTAPTMGWSTAGTMMQDGNVTFTQAVPATGVKGGTIQVIKSN